MIVRLLVRDVEQEDIDAMICAMEKDFQVDVELEDIYEDD